MKSIIFLIFTFITSLAWANEIPITKSLSPGVVNIRLTGTGMSQFSVRFADLPEGHQGRPMKIKTIEWRTAYYAAEGVNEAVHICYYPLGYGHGKPVHCEKISPNASGVIDKFASLRFGFDSRITIRHELNGGRLTAYPTGQDTVVIHYQR